MYVSTYFLITKMSLLFLLLLSLHHCCNAFGAFVNLPKVKATKQQIQISSTFTFTWKQKIAQSTYIHTNKHTNIIYKKYICEYASLQQFIFLYQNSLFFVLRLLSASIYIIYGIFSYTNNYISVYEYKACNYR